MYRDLFWKACFVVVNELGKQLIVAVTNFLLWIC